VCSRGNRNSSRNSRKQCEASEPSQNSEPLSKFAPISESTVNCLIFRAYFLISESTVSFLAFATLLLPQPFVRFPTTILAQAFVAVLLSHRVMCNWSRFTSTLDAIALPQYDIRYLSLYRQRFWVRWQLPREGSQVYLKTGDS